MDKYEWLLHYGVLGMKWGVRKDDVSKGRRKTRNKDASDSKKNSSSTPNNKSSNKKWIEADRQSKKPLSEAQKTKNLAEAKNKFRAKVGADPVGLDQESKKGWRPNNKQVAAIIIGAAAVGYLSYVGYKAYKSGAFSEVSKLAGKAIDKDTFNSLVYQSQMKIWKNDDYLHAKAFARPEFTLPKGHVFHRLSTTTERSFRGSTYATSNLMDFNRYVSAFRSELMTDDLKHITFSSLEDIRVPSLSTKLDIFKSTLRSTDKGRTLTDPQIVAEFKKTVGTSYEDATSLKFIENLIKAGYSAMVDDMDAGIVADTPLVIIDPTKFTSKLSIDLTKDAIELADNTLIELLDRVM